MKKEDWQAEYDRYRASPEFKKVHQSMSLEDFKFIFWMEYAHRCEFVIEHRLYRLMLMDCVASRMWGRLLGVAFVLPGSYFLARGYINAALGKRLGVLFMMGGTQVTARPR